MRAKTERIDCFSAKVARGKRMGAQRDPYDGLRRWSAITHGGGAAAAAVGTLLLLLRAWRQGGKIELFVVYGISMLCLYLASTLYHSVNTTAAKRVALRKYDHCSIYLLIAGSYTPICVLALEQGLPLLILIWLLAAAGVVLTVMKLDIPRWLTSVIYLAMGWMALVAIAPIHRALPAEGFGWLLTGGILYTVGGILYAIKWPGRYNPRFGCHEIFHVFILLGSTCHFLMMYRVLVWM